MEFKVLQADEVLFREGDSADFFYIILYGKMNILKRKDKEDKMTGEEYINHLIQLKINGDHETLKKTVEINQNTFPIDHKYFDNLHEIINLMKIRNSLYFLDEITPEIEKLLLEYNHSLKKRNVRLKPVPSLKSSKSNRISRLEGLKENEKLKLNESYESSDESSSVLIDEVEIPAEITPQQLKEIKRNTMNVIDKDIDFIKYNYVLTNEKKTVTIFYNYKFFELNEGSCFGDTALDSKIKKRNATISAKEYSILARINEKTFISYIQNERNLLKNIEISFLTQNFYFQSVKNNIFKNYFDFFAFYSRNKGETIFTEGDSTEYIYFMKDGECEITMNIDFYGLVDLIKKLSKILKMKVDEFQFDQS